MSEPAKDIADNSAKLTVLNGGNEKPEYTTIADIAIISLAWFTIAWFVTYPIVVSIVSAS